MASTSSLVSEITDGGAPLPADASAAVILFTATWHEACAVNGPMDQLLQALASSSPSSTSNTVFRSCDAEEQSAVAEQFGIEQVPTFCLVHKQQGDWKVVHRFTGEDPAAISTAVQRLIQAVDDEDDDAPPPPPKKPEHQQQPSIQQRLDSLIRSHPVMLFMKGSPVAPRCGFSRQIVELLQQGDIPFGHFDILSDETVRQKLKEHSNWPTYPQLYAKGELVGGLDIVKEMMMDDTDNDASLAEQLGVASPTQRLEQLLHRSPVMLFMKGLPSQPRCGFSKTIVELLQGYENVPLDAFDILTDEQVRQGLKEYSKWPTYPQLYVNGELVGGLDIVREMHEDGSLGEILESAK